MALSKPNLIEILIQARDEATRTIDKVGDALDRADKRAIAISASVAALGASAIAGVTSAAVRSSKFADELASLSDRLQVSTDLVATLGTAFVKSGGQISDSEPALRQFTRTVVDAASGNKEAAASLKVLGIGIDQLSKQGGGLKSIEDLLPLVAEGFSKVQDRALRVDAAVTLFGRSGNALIPILERGRAGLEEYRNEAERLGISLGDERTRQIAQLRTELNTLHLATDGTALAFGNALAPALAEVAHAATDAVTHVGEFARANPEFIRVATSIAGVVTAGGTAVTTLLLIKQAGEKVVPILNSLGVASLFASRQLTLVNGSFIVSNVVRWSTVVGGVVSIVGALAAALELNALAHRHEAEEAQHDAGAEDRFRTILESGTASINEQVAALNELHDARVRTAAREADPGPFSVENQRDVVVRAQIKDEAKARAEKEFEEEYGDLLRRLQSKARLMNKAFGELTEADTIIVPEPKLEFKALPDSGVEAQIQRQREIVQRDRKDLEDATARRTEAEKIFIPVDVQIKARTGDKEAIAQVEAAEAKLTQARGDEQQAVDKVAQSEQRLSELTQRLSERRKTFAQTTRDSADALNELKIAEGSVQSGDVAQALAREITVLQTLEQAQKNATEAAIQHTRAARERADVQKTPESREDATKAEEAEVAANKRLIATQNELADAKRRAGEVGALDVADQVTKNEALQRATVEIARAEVELARIRSTQAGGSIEEQERAMNELDAALRRYESSLGALRATEGQQKQTRAQQAEDAKDLAEAYRELEQAQVRAGVAGKNLTDIDRDRALRKLEVQERESDVLRAASAFDQGPLPAERQIEALRKMAQAQDALTDSKLQSDKADSKSPTAKFGANLFDDATRALLSFGDHWDSAWKQMGVTAISELAQIALKMLATKAEAIGIGIATSKAATATAAASSGAALGARASAVAAAQAASAATTAAAAATAAAGAATTAVAAAGAARAIGATTGGVGGNPFATLLGLPLLLFQHGGKVPESRGVPGRDSVAALLSPGERVITDSFEEKLLAAVGSGAKGVVIYYQPGYSTASEAESRRFLRHTHQGLSRYRRRDIAEASLS